MDKHIESSIKARKDVIFNSYSVTDAARNIPGVGEAMSIKQHVDFFSRFKKKDS